MDKDCLEFRNGSVVGNGEHETTNTSEMQYLNEIKHILTNGKFKNDRTEVGTYSVFGSHFRYNLRNGIVEELLWFISGSTNSKLLSEKKVHIWDANGSRSFLDKQGLVDREEGDLGPIYGFQWRHFGATYENANSDYTGQGVDQLMECIHLIKTDPNNRRIIMSAWNPCDIPKMALPPCHCLVQFYVSDGELSCQLYQRSADMGLGVPFNVASYSLLVYMIAHVTGLKPGDFVHTTGDTHVYSTHVDALKEQLTRKPKPFPKLKIKRDVSNIEDFKFDDFELIGYNPYPKISMPMAV